jgi:hypothetical protein
MKTIVLKPNQYRGLTIVLIILTFLGSGCFRNFYAVKQTKSISNESLQQLKNKGKNFIYHDGMHTWSIQNPVIENDVLSGEISRLSPERENYPIMAIPGHANRFRRPSENFIIHEVHIYANFQVVPSAPARIPINSISRIDIYNPDYVTTLGSWVLGGYGVVGGTAILAGIIFVASWDPPAPKPPAARIGSCPFIYTCDGEKNSFAGEIFSGAIFPALEKNDYLNLTGIQPVENYYHILMSNMDREIQHTNLAEILVIDHPLNTEIFIDKNGHVLTCSDIRKPWSALDQQGNSLLKLLSEADNLSYMSGSGNNEDNIMDEIILTFKIPQNHDEGKLIIRARNSLLLDQSFVKFLGFFGNKTKWLSNKPADELKNWSKEQGIPLSVYIEKKHCWKLVGQFDIPGPLAFKDNILEIDLSGIEESDLHVKLISGKLFWDLDRAGMDFSENSPLDVTIVKPFRAINQDSADVVNLILQDDSAYFVQPEIGDMAEIMYRVPETRLNSSRSVFLHSKGYYTILPDYAQPKSMVYLNRFNKPGSFTRFVRKNYFGMLESAMK